MQNIAIIIPVYNEEKYLPEFLQQLITQVNALSEIKTILFVDDGSTDHTVEIIKSAQAKSPKLKLLSLEANKGKGAAMSEGLKEAQKLQSDAVIFMDGDGQHDPQFLPAFIDALDTVPIVFGYRLQKENTPLLRKLGNQIAAIILHNIFDIKRNGDVLCGFFALRKDVFEKVQWQSKDYGVEAELSAIIGRKKIPFKEIRINTVYLDASKGVNLLHALIIFFRIPYWNYIYSHE